MAQGGAAKAARRMRSTLEERKVGLFLPTLSMPRRAFSELPRFSFSAASEFALARGPPGEGRAGWNHVQMGETSG